MRTGRAMRDNGLRRARRVRARLRRRHLAFPLIAILVLLNLLLGTLPLLAAVMLENVRAAYLYGIVAQGKQQAFALTVAFLVTFGLVRLITYSVRYPWLPFCHNIRTPGGVHVHHMVPGMLLVLVSGYFGLVLSEDRWSGLLAILFGIGAALVLDEFALWLRLADVYWEPEGRESIDAVVLAAGLGILYILGLDFWPYLAHALLERLPHSSFP